ncbi:MAG: peptidase U32 family protein [Chitinophagales bacterium]
MTEKVELLAPVGKWPVLEEVIRTGADAVYLGGKRFNMRLLRPDFNFSDQELKDAVSYCHDRGVKLYITANNLYFEDEVRPLLDYLRFLKDIGIDALIVQDLAPVRMLSQEKIDLPLHASVQRGVNNLNTARQFEGSGFTRVILSKNVSLEEIRSIHNGCGLGIEYFVHGDLCISHTGQCFMSGLIFGEGGNRGRCRKPCRWRYQVEGPKQEKYKGYQYFLAHKDLCLQQNFKDLIEAGVTSFKIEGRMRDADYLGFLVSTYRRALDACLEGRKPSQEDWQELYEKRARDFTTGSLYNSTSGNDIGFSGEREPHFPTSPMVVTTLKPEDYRPLEVPTEGELELVVKVGGPAGMDAALEAGVRCLIFPLTFYHNRAWAFKNLADISEAIEKAVGLGAHVSLETPRIISEKDKDFYDRLLEMPNLSMVSRIIVNDPGGLFRLAETGIELQAGIGLNLTNSLAVEQVREWGAKCCSPAVDLSFQDLMALAANSSLPLEVMVQGPMCGIVSDYCLAGTVNRDDEECNAPCEEYHYALVDELGQKYPVESDLECRSYIYAPRHMALFHLLPILKKFAIKRIRVEGEGYSPDILIKIISIYRSGLEQVNHCQWEQEENYRRLLSLFSEGVTAATLHEATS